MVVIDMDMPKSCEKCKAICSRFNGNETVYYCGLTELFIANYSEDLCEPRDVNCPIKCDIEDIKAEIEQNIGDNLYKNDGLYLALQIIDKYTPNATITQQ